MQFSPAERRTAVAQISRAQLETSLATNLPTRSSDLERIASTALAIVNAIESTAGDPERGLLAVVLCDAVVASYAGLGIGIDPTKVATRALAIADAVAAVA